MISIGFKISFFMIPFMETASKDFDWSVLMR